MPFLVLFIAINFMACRGQDLNLTKKMEAKSNREALVSKAFPELKAQTLARQNIVFPKDVMGKPTVICVAFVGNAQSLIDTWAVPILAKYPNQEVNYYEIPMINAAWGVMSGMIDGGMRSGVPKELHKNVATYYGSLSGYKNELMMPDKKSCYVFLLDKTGIIQYVNEYSSTPEKLADLYTAIDKVNSL